MDRTPNNDIASPKSKGNWLQQAGERLRRFFVDRKRALGGAALSVSLAVGAVGCAPAEAARPSASATQSPTGEATPSQTPTGEATETPTSEPTSVEPTESERPTTSPTESDPSTPATPEVKEIDENLVEQMRGMDYKTEYKKLPLEQQLMYGAARDSAVINDAVLSDYFAGDQAVTSDGDFLSEHSPMIKPLTVDSPAQDIVLANLYAETMVFSAKEGTENDLPYEKGNGPLDKNEASKYASYFALPKTKSYDSIINTITQKENATVINSLDSYKALNEPGVKTLKIEGYKQSFKSKTIRVEYTIKGRDSMGINEITYVFLPNAPGLNGSGLWVRTSVENIE